MIPNSVQGLEADVQVSVILLNPKTQGRHIVPVQFQVGSLCNARAWRSIVLPEKLPAGRYHVFFELREADKVISMGHYFAAEL